jgi:NADPH2 dehydrogenase
MTRVRADDNHVQLPFAKDYYSQRACVPGTLLITEATFISPRASGYLYIPGIWSTEQVAAWRTIAEDVHDAGGIIFLQLGALGRTANPDVKGKENTGDVVGASAVPENSDKPVPRPLSEEEIQEYINDYAIAAKNAVDGAGFDGVGTS